MKLHSNSNLARAVLSGAVLFYVAELSLGDRNVIDWSVIALVGGAVLWNLLHLGRRLRRVGGRKGVWHMLRMVLFWVIGLMNTAFLRPEDVDGWRNWVGWAFVVIAALDTVALAFKERKALRRVI